LSVALLVGIVAGAAAAPADAATAAPRSCHKSRATLRCAARYAGLRVGVGHEAGVRADDRLAAREFDSVTLEGSLLWNVVHPAPGRWDFSGADRTVAWARRNRLRITATHFVWDQIVYQSTPAWVKQITDPRQLRAVMAQHLRTITRRYGSSIDRWIVVNEPLRYVGDTTAIQENHFSRVLGPDWIAESFRIARRAAPTARLWLNEIFTEADPAKAGALVRLAHSLVARGVPIDGVGLQGHLFTSSLQPTAPNPRLVRATLRKLTALGLQVSFTEIDAPTFPGTPDRLAEQARRIRTLVTACLQFRRCTSLTFWNLHDGRSWLNGLFGRSDLAPTLFSASLRPKPAYFAVRRALASGRRARRK
jgi:endo-1,4-beta-xylanase